LKNGTTEIQDYEGPRTVSFRSNWLQTFTFGISYTDRSFDLCL